MNNLEQNPQSCQTDVRRSFIGAMWYYHKFFVKETPSFIAQKGQRWRVRKTWTTEIHEQYYPLTFGQKMKYPIAYLKYMVMMAKDYFAWKRGQNCA